MTASAEANPGKQPKKQLFVSLRIRLLVGFTVIFTGVFSAAYYWFYTFAVSHAIERLRADANSTLLGAAEGVNVDELLELYATGQPNSDGFSDDVGYQNQMEWLRTVQKLEPRAWPYTYVVVGEDDVVRRQRQDGSVEISPPQDPLEVIGLVDLWAIHDPRKSYRFLESDHASQYTLRAWHEGRLVERVDIYQDDWGEWMTSYIPLRDSSGNIVAMMGLDIEASYVTSLKDNISDQMLISFALAYSSLFVLVYIISSHLTKPLKTLGHNAQHIASAEYNNLEALSNLTSRRFQDEFSELARVFQIMVVKIRGREESLKTQVKILTIEIDEARKQKEVSEIVNSDFFLDLQSKARVMRKRMNRESSLDEDEKS